MTAELIFVGTELLLGNILNTNAKYLSEQFASLGIDCYYQTVVGDNAGRLKETFLNAWNRSDIVIFSGGLGPTEDDLTKETVAEALDLPMVMDKKAMDSIREFFARRGLEMPPINEISKVRCFPFSNCLPSCASGQHCPPELRLRAPCRSHRPLRGV